jgi:hypothetical protein
MFRPILIAVVAYIISIAALQPAESGTKEDAFAAVERWVGADSAADSTRSSPRIYESVIAFRFVFSRKIRGPATFDFCNTIPLKAGAPATAARGQPSAKLIRLTRQRG